MNDPNEYEEYQSLPLWKQIALSSFMKGIVKGIPHVGPTFDQWLYGDNLTQTSPSTSQALQDFLRFLELEIDASKQKVTPESVHQDLEKSLEVLELFSTKYCELTLPHDNPFIHLLSDEAVSDLVPLFEKFVFHYQRAYKWSQYLLKKTYTGKALQTRIKELNNIYKKQSVSHRTSLEKLSCITNFKEMENQSFGTVRESIIRHMELIRGIKGSTK